MRKAYFDREFLVPTLFFLAITVLVYFWQPFLAVIPGILTVGAALFFRDPHRIISADKNEIVSPADGTVMSVKEDDERDFFNCKVKKVSIFLSVFNVHINRTPIKGRVTAIRYLPGKFKAAYKECAATENEKNILFIEGEKFPVLVVQIAGLIARRIVCRVQEGSELEQGERFGLIRFGSCTEIYVPQEVEILVSKGDKVRGGESVIGRWNDEK